jgi:hypothetical protein
MSSKSEGLDLERQRPGLRQRSKAQLPLSAGRPRQEIEQSSLLQEPKR